MKHRHCISIIIAFLLFQGCHKEVGVPKHVFFIVIDALRADHLGCYGYKVPTSPTIDRLADEGIIFKNAYATASNTLESVFSFFNSTTALTNNVHEFNAFEAKSLSASSLQKKLKDTGYNTLAVVSNPWLKYHQDYFQDGFSHFHFVVTSSA
jgi:arylsulfatase